jgi:hypothetical protein
VSEGPTILSHHSPYSHAQSTTSIRRFWIPTPTCHHPTCRFHLHLPRLPVSISSACFSSVIHRYHSIIRLPSQMAGYPPLKGRQYDGRKQRRNTPLEMWPSNITAGIVTVTIFVRRCWVQMKTTSILLTSRLETISTQLIALAWVSLV